MLVYAGQRTQCTLFSPLAGTVCCNMLQCVAGFCSQSEHPEMDIRKIYYAATHCNTLQLTATHCNAMFQVVLLQNNSWWMSMPTIADPYLHFSSHSLLYHILLQNIIVKTQLQTHKLYKIAFLPFINS